MWLIKLKLHSSCHILIKSLILILTLEISVAQLQQENLEDAVDPNASGLTNCNKCTIEFLKLCPSEQAIWTKYLVTNKNQKGNGPSDATVEAFRTMGDAAAFNHPDIETLELEEKNLVKYYKHDLKLPNGEKEIGDKLNSLYQTLAYAYAWKAYQEQIMNTKQYEQLANNGKSGLSTAEINQIVNIFNKTDSTKPTHEEF